MKYAVVATSNGNFSIHSEHGTNLTAAIMEWHNYCRALWNEASVVTAEVKIMDENLDRVEGYAEFIRHDPASVQEA